MYDKTMTFSVSDEKEIEMKKTLMLVYDALTKKGYNPVNQIVGYILSEDPTYITTYNNARTLIRHIDRDELLQALVKSYPERIERIYNNAWKSRTAGLRTSRRRCGFLLSSRKRRLCASRFIYRPFHKFK